jgi:lysophospholipase L1-like esterase
VALIIAGDSYSVLRKGSWVSQIETKIKPLGVSGYSNLDILKSLDKIESQLAIISLTHLKRLPYELTTIVNDNITIGNARDERAVKLNTKAAHQIIKRWKKAYIWSSFPDYESWPEVHFIPLYKENQLWIGDVGEFTQSTTSKYKNHLTEKGNCDLANHMNAWIKEKMNETY